MSKNQRQSRNINRERTYKQQLTNMKNKIINTYSEQIAYILLRKLCWVNDVKGLTKHLIGPTLVVERLRVHLCITWTISTQWCDVIQTTQLWNKYTTQYLHQYTIHTTMLQATCQQLASITWVCQNSHKCLHKNLCRLVKWYLYAGPHAWNSLPEHLQQTTSIELFKRSLKTFLFRQISHWAH